MKLYNPDKRLLWLLLALVLAVPLLFRVTLPPLEIAPATRAFYNTINKANPGDIIVLSIDFIPSFNPELAPTADAVCRHAFSRNLRVIGLSLVDGAVGTAQMTLERNARLFGKVYGRDYVYLGWQPNEVFVIQGLSADFAGVFPKDLRGTPLDRLEIFRAARSLYDIPLIVQVGAGFEGVPSWLAYGTDKTGGKLAVACNGGAEMVLRPYYASGQLAGLASSTRGGAEYEQLLGLYGPATRALNAISLAQLFLLFLLIMANFLYWRSKGYPLPWRGGGQNKPLT